MFTRLTLPGRASGRTLPVLFSCLIALTLAVPALATTTITWNNPAGGLWSDASNWSPAQVPDSFGESAVLPALSGPYQVTLDINPALDQLQVATGATLDLDARSIGSITQLYNAGTLLGLRGTLYGSSFHNQSGGVARVAHNDSITVLSGLTNDGEIIVGPDSTSALYLPYAAGFDGNGKITLLTRARISCPLERPQTSIWFTNSGNHTLAGAGDVWVPVKNNINALLAADGSVSGTMVYHCYFQNYGTTRASGGGSINIDCPLVVNRGQIVGSGGTFTVMMPYAVGGLIDNRGGQLVADGGNLSMGCGLIWDGVVNRTGGSGSVRIISVATAQNLTVNAGSELGVDGLLDLTASGSHLENHGTVSIKGVMQLGGSTADSISLTGDGVLVLEGGTLAGGGTMINTAGHTITGCGSINLNLVNYGTLEVDCAAGQMSFGGGLKTNLGPLRVKRGQLWVWGEGSQLKNRGTVDVADGSFRIDRGGVLDNTGGSFTIGSQNAYLGWRQTDVSIIGGTLSAVDGGAYLNVGKTTLHNVTLGPGAKFTTQNKGTTTADGASLINHGTNRIETGGSFAIGSATHYLDNGGATVLAGGTLSTPSPWGLQVHGVLSGTGKIVGDVFNSGIVSPDAAASGLQVQGAYHQSTSGKLCISLAGFSSDQFSQLKVTGGASLGGSLAVSAATGFDPGTGHAFQVLTSDELNGQFATMDPSPALVLVPVYDGANLTLQATSALAVGDPTDSPRSLRFYARGAGFGLDLPEAAQVSVRAYDITGREVARLADGTRAAGIYRLDLRNGTNLPSGVYFARAQMRFGARNEIRSARLVFLK